MADDSPNQTTSEDTGADAAPVLSERHGGVLRLTLNRPDRLNAWTPQMADRLFALLREGDADPQVRAIVVTGAGRAFCAGADMEALSGISGERLEVDGRSMALPATLQTPVVAAVNGPAAGVGLALALFCDVRFAADDAKLTTSFSRRGLVAEYGIAWQLPRLVGQGRAMDLLLSSRVVLGDEARGMGMVDFSLAREDVLTEALAYAGTLAAECSPRSMAAIKGQVVRAQSSGLDAAADEAAELMADAFASEDFAEGITSYLEKRPPRFPGLGARE